MLALARKQPTDGDMAIVLARRVLLLETAIAEHCDAAPKKADLSRFDGIGITHQRLVWGGMHRTGSAALTTLAAGGWSIF